MNLKKDYAMARSWGEALRRRRLKKRMTQEVLHLKSGVCCHSISGYERGGILPYVSTAYKLLQALDWTLEEWAESAKRIEEDGSWYNERYDFEYAYSNTQLLTERDYDYRRI